MRPLLLAFALALAAGSGAARAEDPPAPQPVVEGLETALAFFDALHRADAAEAAAHCAAPFAFEGERVVTPGVLRARLTALLAARPYVGVELFGVEVLTPEEMRARHGEPPERLGKLPLRGRRLAIANFGGHAVVAVLARTQGRWAVVALTD